MKIQAINTNTNFRGLFTDKTSQNGGNWRMEYQPYSWEKNEAGEIGKMANKARISLYDTKLPDNEEIFKENGRWYKEISMDILGTSSYYKAYDGKMRRTITEMPAMSREDSLKVLDKKYERFLSEKQDKKYSLEKAFGTFMEGAEKASKSYDSWSNYFNEGYFDRSSSRKEIKKSMDEQKQNLKRELDGMYENARNYMNLRDSMDSVKFTRQKIQNEILRIKILRESGKLIDISSRTVENPNAPLQAALQNIKAAAEKFVCLPHKLISMSEILKQVNPRVIQDGYNNEIIYYIESLIKKGI